MHNACKCCRHHTIFVIYCLIISHQEDFHEIIQVSVEHSLRIRGLVTGAQVLDHLVRMKHIASYLGAPFDLLLLALKFSLFFLPFLEFYVVETGFEDSQGILPVIELGAGLGVLHNNP